MVVSPPPLVRIRALAKRYGPRAAVTDVDLEVAPGEIVGLLGANGAGKTTTLECLLGLRTPDAGELSVAGFDVGTEATQMLGHVGAQIQPASLQDQITPREALAFFGTFHRTPAHAGTLLAQFGLQEKADARFATLSHGERQRLSVALAFVGRPPLLVLDEPTTGLDPRGRHDLHRILREHRAAGGSILLSTHDLDEAESLCDRVAIIHRGRIVANESPVNLVAKARSATTISFRSALPLASLPAAITALVSVSSDHAGAVPGVQKLNTHEPARAVAALTEHLATTGNELLELQLRPPSLEDAFLALTGERWEGEA